MDTISRENNSYLPIAGVIVGVLALVLSCAALVKLSTLGKKVPDGLVDSVAKIDVIESEARSATSAVERVGSNINSLSRSSQDAFNQVAGQIQEIRGELTKMQESRAPKAAASKGPVVAGPGEYVVKAGDSGAKIAREHGFSLADLQAVNPGVTWTRLKVGDKLKLPKK